MWHNLMEAKWEPKKVTVFKMFRHVSRNFNPSNPNIHRHLPISDCRMLFSKYQVWFAPVWHLHNTGRQALHHLPRFSYSLKVQRCKPAKKPAQLSGFTALSLSLWSLGLETRIVVPRTTSFCWKKSCEKSWLQKTPQPRFLRVPKKTQQGLTLRNKSTPGGKKLFSFWIRLIRPFKGSWLQFQLFQRTSPTLITVITLSFRWRPLLPSAFLASLRIEQRQVVLSCPSSHDMGRSCHQTLEFG